MSVTGAAERILVSLGNTSHTYDGDYAGMFGYGFDNSSAADGDYPSSDYLDRTGAFRNLSTNIPCFINDTDFNYSACIFNASLNDTNTEKPPKFPLWQIITISILVGCLSIVTVVGNFIVVLSFVLERTIRQPTNFFIASLAVSDLLIGGFSMPLYTMYLLMGDVWPLGPVICDLWLCLDYSISLSSQYTVLAITIDRFCSVKIPAKYRGWRTAFKVKVMVAAAWVVPAAVFYTSILGWQYFVGERTVPEGSCYVQFMENALFNACLVIAYFWSTLIVMCVLYTQIYRVALKLQRKSEAKHKKMTSLVSMAGQTMTKIGIGMSQKAPDKNNPVNGKEQNRSANRGTSTTTTFTSSSTKNTTDKEDHSSSPGFASDTDPSDTQSPSPRNSFKNSNTVKAEIVNNSKKKRYSSLKVPKLQLPSTQPNGHKSTMNHSGGRSHSLTPEISTSDIDTSGYSPSPNPNDSSNNPKVSFKFPSVSPKTGPRLSVRTNDSGVGDLVEEPLTPPQVSQGLKYIDTTSLQASEHAKLLVDQPSIKDEGNDSDDNGSPVWRRRISSEPDGASPPQVASEGDSTASAPTETGAQKFRQKVNMLVQMSNNSRANSGTVTSISGASDLHPLDGNRSDTGSKAPSIRDLVMSMNPSKILQRRKDTEKQKQKSKSENRARKALRVITIILALTIAR
ncbi:unnamed protein product [Owenia fusiformis]|uniref:G-protein coupled receptors family 1 profile domain-containing protein n=1 Tax=Owenia fusiformis TaxID=6347 RepID=A0A8S4N1T9_OWEFU|nr:unnamed protein product [Owenia fusiformis]